MIAVDRNCDAGTPTRPEVWETILPILMGNYGGSPNFHSTTQEKEETGEKAVRLIHALSPSRNQFFNTKFFEEKER